MHIFTRYNAK